MAEQHLDDANVGAGFEKMSGEAVAQRMNGDRFAELGCRPCGTASALEHTRIERPALALTRKQPMHRPCFPPVGAQHDEELRRQHDVAIPAAFTLIDADQHAAAVDVGQLEAYNFRDAEPGGIGRYQCRPVLQVRHGGEEPRQLIGAQDHRQSPRLACVRDALDHRGAAEGDAVEETQGADRDVEAGP